MSGDITEKCGPLGGILAELKSIREEQAQALHA
jgi:hypothetical protein